MCPPPVECISGSLSIPNFSLGDVGDTGTSTFFEDSSELDVLPPIFLTPFWQMFSQAFDGHKCQPIKGKVDGNQCMYIYIYSTYIIFRWTNIYIYIMEMEIPPTHDIYLPDKWLIINSPIELDWAVFFSNLESHGFCKPYKIEIRSWEKTRTSSPIQHSCQGFGYSWRKLPSHVWCNCNCSYMSLQSTHVYTMPASFSIVSWLKADGNKNLAIH